MNKNFLNKVLVFDNIISKELSDKIENELLGPYFPWYMTKHEDDKGNYLTSVNTQLLKFKNNKKIIDNGQLVHTFLKEESSNIVKSLYFNLSLEIIELFIKKMNIKNIKILRIKSNMKPYSTKFKKNSFGIPHKDYEKQHYVMIYYVNDSDGDTFLFDNEKDLKIIKSVEPKKGRILFFDGKILHSAGNPVKNNYRVIINYNFTIE